MADPSPSINPAANTTSGASLGGPLEIKKRARRRLVGAIALVLLAVIVLPMVMDQEPKPITQDIQIHIPSQEPGTGSFISRIKPTSPAPAPTPLPAEPPAPLPAASATAAPTSDTENKPAAPAAAPAKPESKHEVKPESSKSATNPTTSTPPATPATTATTEKPAETKTPAKPAEKSSAAQNSDSTRATALLNDERWVVQLGAYQDQANVKLLQGKIKELGYPIFTEKIDTPQGPRIRVRCGPFPSREAAEKAQARLKKISAGGPTGGVVAQMQ